MKKNCLPLLLFGYVASSFLLTSCEKETSPAAVVPPTDTLATFALTFADEACAIAPTTGTYVVGAPLAADAGFSVEVAVRKAGQYKLTTDTLNGYWFSTSGTFTDTGVQTVTLAASGTPVQAGLNYFSLTAGGVKRLVSQAVLATQRATEPVPSQSYFKGTIGGVAYTVMAPTDGPDDIPYGYGGTDTASFVSYVGPRISPTPVGSGTLSLQKGLFYHFAGSTEQQFKDFFKPGSYPFYLNKCPHDAMPGVIIFWSDADGQSWGSLQTLGNQDGSSFQIVGVEDGHDNKGHYYVKVRSRFNCKLYNLDTQEQVALTDGEMVSFFIRP